MSGNARLRLKPLQNYIKDPLTGIISCARDVIDFVLQCLGSGIGAFPPLPPFSSEVVDLPFFMLAFLAALLALLKVAASSSSLSPSNGSESSASSSLMVE